MFLLLSTAFAGERVFAHSYGYGTVPKGGVEVEHYLTAKAIADTAPSWEHQIELEYGITDQLEAGLYVVGSQAGSGPLAFKGYKARLKYRFGAAGVAPIDVAAYLEYIGNAGGEEHAVEAKAILGKSVGGFEAALNIEYKLEIEDGLKHELEPALGLGYHLAPSFLLGVESKMEMEFEGDEVEGPLAWAGPTVHLAGEGGKVWWTVSALIPLTADSADADGVIVRSLVALNL
jgi:hypothetical protein